MGLEVVAAVIGATAAVGGYIEQQSARKEQKAAAERSEQAQIKSRQEQAAVQAQQRAEAARRAAREERVKRGRLLQASTNTGTAGSSGEVGAASNLSTQFSNNLGLSKGAEIAGTNISLFNQEQASAESAFRQASLDYAAGGQLTNLGFSLFSAGMNAGAKLPGGSPSAASQATYGENGYTYYGE